MICISGYSALGSTLTLLTRGASLNEAFLSPAVRTEAGRSSLSRAVCRLYCGRVGVTTGSEKGFGGECAGAVYALYSALVILSPVLPGGEGATNSVFGLCGKGGKGLLLAFDMPRIGGMAATGGGADGGALMYSISIGASLGVNQGPPASKCF